MSMKERLLSAKPKPKNATEIYNEGYVAGYNQAKVDNGLMTQKDADDILITRGRPIKFTDPYHLEHRRRVAEYRVRKKNQTAQKKDAK